MTSSVPSPRPSGEGGTSTPNRPPMGSNGGTSTNTKSVIRATPNNNYSAPHTPIASAKRPRGYYNNGKSNTPSSTSTPSGYNNNDSSDNNITFSPMHPPTSARTQFQHRLAEEEAQKQQDNKDKAGTLAMLLSPVLHFLGGNSNTSSSNNSTPTKIDFDGDVCMDNTTSMHSPEPEQVEHMVPTTDTSPSVETTDTCSSAEDEDEFNPYLFIKHLPPYQLLHHAQPRYFLTRPIPYSLPPKLKSDPPITLVLDLDETLVHCTVDAIPDADVCFPVLFGGIEYNVHVRLRPHLTGFLKRISRHFEIIVFTASQKVYANELLNRIDPQGQYIRHRMYRESCLSVEGNYLKDLNVLTGSTRSLEQMALVDNSPHAFGYQIDNGIPIESWFDDRADTELLKLEAFLLTLVGCQDVRPLIREKFQTFRLVQEA